ncbi:hypothetical protein IGS68_32285 (plasmid) [Skermanella sp. TT6]|uniref:Uncharacterized protein n=1 Tax=Skermanella cutis TaxID=2775420 RepID=A0ABX7BKD2_9PROT|nr:hypothetical protein [Skermanella sp. TT6]QQP93694.1 hypothetical protein IGS68_32285 [Skermanella sp. TT6]
MNLTDAQSYMDTEGAFWAFTRGYADAHSLELKQPNFLNSLMWRVMKPAMPINKMAQRRKQETLGTRSK